MAFSTALSQALRNKIKTSGVQSTRVALGSDRLAKLQSDQNSSDMYDLQGTKVVKVPQPQSAAPTGVAAPPAGTAPANGVPVPVPGTGTTGNVGTAGTTGISPAGTVPSPTGVAGPTLSEYEQNLGITPADKAAREKATSDLLAANAAKAGYSASDYYNQLVGELGRAAPQSDLDKAQQAAIGIQGGITAQGQEVSTGGEGMLSQARQNAARALPLNQQLAVNIAQQNLDVNKLNNIDNQIKLRMDLKSQDLQNKASSIQDTLNALKGKVPDYMINFANQQLQQKMQEQAARNTQLMQTGDINSTDPFLKKKAIANAVADVYKTYEGMPFGLPQSAHVENIERLMGTGVSFQDAIKQDLTTPIQNKPEYKQWQISKGLVRNPLEDQTRALQNQKLAQDIATGKLIETKDKDGNPIFVDAVTRKVVDVGLGGVGGGEYDVTAGTTTNRPDRNNNPGNVKVGDVGFGVDDQNHTIFGSAQAGYQAMVKDLTAKMTGNTRWGLTPDSTLAQLGKIYAEDPKWASNVASLAGYNVNTKLSDIDVNKLAPAVAKAEGFTGKVTQKAKTGEDKDTVDTILNGTLKVSDLPTGDRERIGNQVNKEIEKRIKDEKDNNRATIIKSAAYTGKLSDTTTQKINKIDTVASQLGDIVNLLSKAEGDTGPIAGILSSNNPYNTKAQQIQALIQATVPNLARGVFGEVGVLTDNDIANYTKTMPNLKSTTDVNKLITDMLQKTLAKTYMDTIANAAKSKANVSNYLQDYDNAKKAYEPKLSIPTADQIQKATPKVIADIQAGMSLEDMKKHATEKGFDPKFVEDIYNQQIGIDNYLPVKK